MGAASGQAMNALDKTWEELSTRESWSAWLTAARVENPDLYDWWHTDEGCHGCVHFDTEATWCTLVEAPASRNPVLNMLGMACCGAGYDTGNPQLELISESPF